MRRQGRTDLVKLSFRWQSQPVAGSPSPATRSDLRVTRTIATSHLCVEMRKPRIPGLLPHHLCHRRRRHGRCRWRRRRDAHLRRLGHDDALAVALPDGRGLLEEQEVRLGREGRSGLRFAGADLTDSNSGTIRWL